MKTVPNPPSQIQMYATPYCGDTRLARRVLDEMQIAYDFIDFRQDPAGWTFCGGDQQRLPQLADYHFPRW